MVYDKVDGSEWVDSARIKTQCGHGVAHRGEIDHSGNAGEILHQNTGWPKGDLTVALAHRKPKRGATNIVGSNCSPILMAEQIFEQHLEREGQQAHIRKAVPLRLF